MQTRDYRATYRRHLDQLISAHGRERAMELVVGGKFFETGQLEVHALRQLGLQPDHAVVDVGCGSGRLAIGLESFLTGSYQGIDVLSDALDYARQRCRRDDWNFVETEGMTIPVGDGTADFVVFFSVFTHLLDEDIFRYLVEARRVVKPSGRIVFSYLDLESDAHWTLFTKTAAERNRDGVLNAFTNERVIRRLARGAGLIVTTLLPNDHRWIPMNADKCDARSTVADFVEFGQSVAVLERFPDDRYLALHRDVQEAVDKGVFLSGWHHYDVCGHKEGRTVPAA